MVKSFAEICKDIVSGNPAPIYLLHGEESFFIDRLVEKFEELLPEHERSFNSFNLYAIEKDPNDIIDIAMRYPLMASRIVIIVKETQAARGGAGKWINKLAKYASNPNLSTVLVVVARGIKVACKEFTDALKKNKGVIFESPRLRERDVAGIVSAMFKDAGLNCESGALLMITENIGNDLARIYTEVEKLRLTLPPNSTVTTEVIEKNVGISREYNNFELVKSIARRDLPRSLKIIRNFNLNQRDNPSVVTRSVIFSLFANTLIALYTDHTDSAIMAALNVRSSYALSDYKAAMSNYTAAQVVEIIGLIRECDAFCKGNGSRMPEGNLMENLILKIHFATGKLVKRN